MLDSPACKERPSPSQPSLLFAVAAPLSFAPDIPARLKRLPATPITFDGALLDQRETRTVRKLIEASRLLDEVFLRQVSRENPALRDRLAAEARAGVPGAPAALALFEVHKGPWDRLKGDEPFIGSKKKPAGAGFYPEDMTRTEFDGWVAKHPEDKAAFQGLFTVIRREGNRLVAVPYSKEYREWLEPAASRLREAAALTGNASLRDFLEKRASALLSDDYFASDVAWMDLDSDIDLVFGPYEVYEDNLFNYKAAFESFVTVRDKAETEKLTVYASHLPDLERNLPIPDQHKNFSRKFESPIRVVQEVFASADARRGVQTSAFNLPNDERVREAKGSKKVLLKNVMDAKFRLSGRPIAERVIVPDQLSGVSSDAYFNHVLFHELSHGLGPGVVTGPDGRRVETRLLLKNLFSTIEECKADVVGIWSVLYALDQKWLTTFDERALGITIAALAFRSMRFGLEEAHGGGTAVQWNWFRERKAIVPAGGGRFRVDAPRFREAVKSLANELLLIEATGDFARAKKLLDTYAKSTPEIALVLTRLNDIPVDITPVFAAAGEK